MLEDSFRLLTRNTRSRESDGKFIESAGVQWFPTPYMRILDLTSSGDFICISYSWGQGRMANPLNENRPMSDRTLPAIEATLSALQPSAIWIDALCVPSQEPTRSVCLRNMGAIYSAASRVVAVLSSECLPLLEQIQCGGEIDPTAFLVLEVDNWATRAWTYQEIINSKSTIFVAEGGSGVSVPGNDFLSAVMGAISKLKKSQELDSFEFHNRFPKLDSLESLIGDYMTSDYLPRSVYQIMSAMHLRYCEQQDDRFNAMIGVLTTTPPDSTKDLGLHPADYFMRVCETKGDYSFIYAAAPRDIGSRGGWRPVPGPLTPVLAWHAYAGVQTARQHPTFLELDDMVVVVPGKVNEDGRKKIDWLLKRNFAECSSTQLAALLLKRLRLSGFTGNGEYSELECGFFFAQSMPTCVEEPVLVVAASVNWPFGAPGLVLSRIDDTRFRFHDVGVFVGKIPGTGNPILIE